MRKEGSRKPVLGRSCGREARKQGTPLNSPESHDHRPVETLESLQIHDHSGDSGLLRGQGEKSKEL